jgi:predicted ArsR family transcriptional regulator
MTMTINRNPHVFVPGPLPPAEADRHTLLAWLETRPGSTVQELATDWAWSRGYIRRMLDRLEADGFVTAHWVATETGGS